MLKPLALSDGLGGLALSSHTVTIERMASDGKWTTLPSMGSVRPEDAIRVSAHFTNKWVRESAAFWITNSAGQIVQGDPELFDNETQWMGTGSAWRDMTAPALPGVYILHVKAKNAIKLPWGTQEHIIQKTFKVDPNAPKPPAGNGGGFQWPDIPAWVWVILALGLAIALGVTGAVIL
jgi:hypothetical protein